MFDHGFPPYWSTLKKLVWIVGTGIAGASTVWKTVTGALIHITDALASPVKELSVAIEPQQDLTYGDPYPAGGSKNLIPDGTDTNNGYVSGKYLQSDGSLFSNADWYTSEYFPVTAGETYTWSTNGNPNSPSICFYDSGKNFISAIQAAQELPKTFTAPTGAVYCRASQGKGFAILGQQLELGSTPTTVKPYSNICPITGYTEANIWHTNDNLLDAVTANLLPQNNSKVTVSNGVLTAAKSNTAECGFVVPVKPNTVYTFGYVNNYGISTYVRCAEYSSKPTSYDASSRIRVIINDQSASTGTVRKVITTSDKAAYVFFGFYRSYNAAAGTYSNWYAKLGNVSTGYSIHEDNNKQISWQTEAGTVYGGTLTINEDGSVDLVSAMANIASYNGEAINEPWLSSMDKYVPGATPTTGAQVVYTLSTPTTYHLDSIEALYTLVGENNIWADVNGEITLTYLSVPETAFSDEADKGMADFMTLTE